MNTDEMRYFLAVYEGDSISKAAGAAHISPQGLGKSIKRFEKKLGVRLFVRTPIGIVPTEEAHLVAEKVREIVKAEDEMVGSLSGHRQVARTRYLIGRDSMLGAVISEGVADYNALHPKKPVEVVLTRDSENKSAQILIEHGYDYRFLSSETDVLPELPHEQLCTLRMAPIMNCETDVAKRGVLELDDMRHLTLVTENANFAWVNMLRSLCRKRGFELKTRELDRAYILHLLSRPDDVMTFVKNYDADRSPWNDPDFAAPVCVPPFETNIVLQTTEDSVDRELVDCIRKRLDVSPYK